MIKRIKRWLYRKPNKYDDLFFVNIREAFQSLFPCKHEWVQNEQFRRYCDTCGRRQYKAYQRLGPVRLSWADYADVD